MKKHQNITVEVVPLIARVNGIKATLSVYADAIAADMAMNDYINKLQELLNYSKDETLELSHNTLALIAEHERNAKEIELAKSFGQFTWCVNALQDIYNSFWDMKADLPLEADVQ
jgi:hypothetical protein